MAEGIVSETLQGIKDNVLKAIEAMKHAEALLAFSKSAGNDTVELEQSLSKQKLQIQKYKLALRDQGIIIE
jgi:hypothetical protein